MDIAREYAPGASDDMARAATAIVVPHTHWDREWYEPLETMRFYLVQFFDELLDTLEQEPDLPVFLLDGQSVIIEDYLAVRPDQRARVRDLISAGRLRPGPNYVQPDEFHVSGESLVRNLLIGCQVAREFGWVMREGYYPDTFGHVDQLPQILRGFGIATFYAMRGFSQDPDEMGSQFWWEGPDGSRVLTEWLSESYSNAAVLNADPDAMLLHHGALVRYDSLPELLGRLGPRAQSHVMLLLNGGDHLRMQRGAPAMVESLNDGVETTVRLGSLEEFHELLDQEPPLATVLRGELRSGRVHAVFDGIGSTRTPMKAQNERVESHLSGVAERLDAVATLLDGRSSRHSLRYAWRELVKNYAHDSICGCSVDAVHEEMGTRFSTIAQTSNAVADDARSRIVSHVAGTFGPDEIPIVALNPSTFARSGVARAKVLPDLNAPVGVRRFGWLQGTGVDLGDYALIDPDGREVAFTHLAARDPLVADTLDRRKELFLSDVEFVVSDLPALATRRYCLVPRARLASATADNGAPTQTTPVGAAVTAESHTLDNGILRVEVGADGALSVTDVASGHQMTGLLTLSDVADAGDEYGFAALEGDEPRLTDAATCQVVPSDTAHTLRVEHQFGLPVRLSPDRTSRSDEEVTVSVGFELQLVPGSDSLEICVDVVNTASDHRLSLIFPTGFGTAQTVAESAFGVVRRDGKRVPSAGWADQPSGVQAMRRFMAIEDHDRGLQILAEGLHEYDTTPQGQVSLTLLRSVGWLARVDHPLRPHKIGPEIPTPGAQCLGSHRFRLAVRPYAVQLHPGHLFRAAEAFSVPLQAGSVWSRSLSPPSSRVSGLGLSISADEVVLSALKTTEDGSALLVRVFNSADHEVSAVLTPGFSLTSAQRCDLEESSRRDHPVNADGTITLVLGPAEIASALLSTDDTLERD